MNPANKRKMIFCEPCGFKAIYNNEASVDAIEVPLAKIQKNIPVLDPKTQKTIESQWQERKKTIFKCPSCGRAVKLRDILPPYAKEYEQIDKRKELERLEIDKKKRIEDGKPLEKPAAPELLG